MEPWQVRVCNALQKIERGQLDPPFLLIVAPPRSGKSTLVSRSFLPWYIGRHPDHRILRLSASAIQSHNFNVAAQNIMTSHPRYRDLFPHIEPDRVRGWSRSETYVKRQVIGKPDPTIFACGMEGPYQGNESDGIGIDDPLDQDEAASLAIRESRQELFRGVIMDRLVPGGWVVAALTRWSHDDLVPTMVDDFGFHVIHIRALEFADDGETPLRSYSPRYPIERLMEIRKAKGTIMFNCTHQGDPSGLQGLLFNRDWFTIEEEAPTRFQQVIQGWDLATSQKETASYNCKVTIGIDDLANIWILHVWRAQEIWPKVRRRMVEFALSEKPHVIALEEVGFQKAAVQEILEIPQLAGFDIQGIPADRDKVSRALVWQPKAEAGKIKLLRASWNEDYLKELCNFPKGARDDQVDATGIAVFGSRASYTERDMDESEFAEERVNWDDAFQTA